MSGLELFELPSYVYHLRFFPVTQDPFGLLGLGESGLFAIRSHADIAVEQLRDPDLEALFARVSGGTVAPRGYISLAGVLYYYHPADPPRLLLVVPAHLREEILAACHDHPLAGHFGLSKTLALLNRSFYWPGMKASMARYVSSCPECQRHKLPTQPPQGLLEPISVGTPAEKWGFDFVGPFPPSIGGVTYWLVAVDYASRFCVAAAIRRADAGAIIRFFTSLFFRFGVPRSLISDSGTPQLSKKAQAFFALHGIAHRASLPYHQQAAGLAERTIQTLQVLVRARLDPPRCGADWATHLPFAVAAYNSARQDSMGVSPFFLMHGFAPSLPIENVFQTPVMVGPAAAVDEVRMQAADSLAAAQTRQKRTFDRHHRPATFSVGSWVLVRDSGIAG